jgi:hypothetical protein
MGNNRRSERRLHAAALFVPLLLVVLAGCRGGDKPPDADKDGFADTADCAPQDAQTWTMLNFASRDEDADGFRANVGGSVCAGSTLPPDRSAALAVGSDIDCDDANAAKWANRHYEAIDTDRDGFGVAAPGDICTGAALPGGLIAALPATQDLDCDDADVDRWRLLSFASRDEDSDGYRINTSGARCGQDTLPANLHAVGTPDSLIDCDDTSPRLWRRVAVYRDADGDGTGSGAALRQCMGSTPAHGYALTGYDPIDDPSDPSAAATSTLVLASSALAVPDETDDDDVF